MKNFGCIALTGIALLQGVAAACCRSNQCLKAIGSPDHGGLADCSTNVLVTVTASASTVTETVTVVESAVDTVLATETETETASTETFLYTESTTVTASTQTDIIAETITVPVTTTAIETAAATITSTSTAYQVVLKARQSASSSLPTYASTVCPSWDKYVSACKCAGVEPTTITVPVPVETVTVTADSTVTSVVSTLSTTETDIISVTASTSSTETDTISLTATVSTTQTGTVSSTATVSQTVTPTVTVPLTCKPRGQAMRISSPYTDGTTRWMNVVNMMNVAWQTGVQPGTTGPSTYSYTWTLDSNGYLELANKIGAATSVLAPYVDLTAAQAPSMQIRTQPRTVVEAAVAAGTYARLSGCVNAATNEVYLSGAGRSNILLCGNTFFLSNGTGSDQRVPCTRLFPTATLV